MRILKGILFTTGMLISLASFATKLSVTMHMSAAGDTQGKAIGTIQAKDTDYGLLLIPDLHDLPPGMHGFHVHETPNCGDKGMKAGGHFDPAKTNKHLGPYNFRGHDGDLPALFVNKNGDASLPVLAPRLTTKDLHGHALMIHAGSDNYSDMPLKLGGGGARIACGIVK